jgi:hypothetical protein
VARNEMKLSKAILRIDISLGEGPRDITKIFLAERQESIEIGRRFRRHYQDDQMKKLTFHFRIAEIWARRSNPSHHRYFRLTVHLLLKVII